MSTGYKDLGWWISGLFVRKSGSQTSGDHKCWWNRRESNSHPGKCTSALIPVGTLHDPILTALSTDYMDPSLQYSGDSSSSVKKGTRGLPHEKRQAARVSRRWNPLAMRADDIILQATSTIGRYSASVEEARRTITPRILQGLTILSVELCAILCNRFLQTHCEQL